jgi:hypothetical protein
MKSISNARSAAGGIANTSNRRDLIVGAGVVGVAFVATRALHDQPARTAKLMKPEPPGATGVGYQATPHVQRYYETAKS